MERPSDTTLLPCGHTCLCIDCCASLLMGSIFTCPLCRRGYHSLSISET